MSPDSAPRRFRVGLDQYGLFPLALSPLDTLRWAAGHGAEGVAFSGFSAERHAAFTREELTDLAAFARQHDLYLEWGGARHIPRDMTTWERCALDEHNRRVAEQASCLDVRVVRSCSGGLMRWNPEAPPTETLLRDTAEALRGQRGMLRDLGVVLAIETHFEFTSHELVRLFDWCEAEPGDWLGVCLDTMNLLTMLEDPLSASRRLLPWVVSTHIKDGGVLVGANGLSTFTAPIGTGVVDLEAILSSLATLDRGIHLSIEDHGGSFDLPIFDPAFLSRFPDLGAGELARLIGLAVRTSARPACRPLPRPDWPRVCEQRLANDLVALRQLAGSAPIGTDFTFCDRKK